MLAFRDVTCRRGGRDLFAGLSFALAAGDAAIVTGPNGVGKSSLIRLAAGLLAPVQGTVVAEGGVALLGEASALDGERTLAAALGFWATLDGGADIVPAMVEMDLTALADVPVRLLSTGQRRRAAIARVIACPAAIWLLDEPGNGLDVAAIARLETAVATHRTRGGIALIATHAPIALPGAQAIAL